MSYSALAILVMMNNYFHDLATALFAVSVTSAWFIHQALADKVQPGLVQEIIGKITRLGWFALAWTLGAGFIRMLAFKRFEWVEAAGKAQVPALVVKHIFLVCIVGFGVHMLIKVRRIHFPPDGAKEAT